MEAALQIHNITAGYASRPDVLNITTALQLEPYKITALIGPNATGKSTLLRTLAGLIPAKGTISFNNENMLEWGLNKRAAHIGYMPQQIPWDTGLSVLESVLLMQKNIQASITGVSKKTARQKVLDLLEQMHLLHLANEPLNRLSGGQKQMISLAQTVIRTPKILLLDEPTSALDLHYQVEVLEWVKKYAASGAIVVMVLHDINLALKWADNIAVLHQGKLIAAGAAVATITPELLQQVYKVHAVVDKDTSGAMYVSVTGKI